VLARFRAGLEGWTHARCAAAYFAHLGAAGYRVRRVPPPFDFTFATDGALDA
jgi:hypothetical protein